MWCVCVREREREMWEREGEREREMWERERERELRDRESSYLSALLRGSNTRSPSCPNETRQTADRETKITTIFLLVPLRERERERERKREGERGREREREGEREGERERENKKREKERES